MAPQPSDKEIALLAFKHWKEEGCLHLRPEHWLTAEKELLAAYAAPGHSTFVPAAYDRMEDFFEPETTTFSCCAINDKISLTTKGWS